MTAYPHVYVHVPFCARRCSYCDFAIAVRRNVPVTDFVDGVAQELEIRTRLGQLDRAASTPARTVYLGGGTPSRLGGEGVALLLDSLARHLPRAADAEVTIEANPEDITPFAVKRWIDAGVNRLSMGVQSFDERALTWMHRVHDATAVTRAINIARDAGITEYSIDLIFALPAALNRDWSRDLDEALALEPTHISLYGLTIESGTPLGRWTARGDVQEAPEETYEAEFLLAHERLTAAGFAHYEVSNYARAGRRARHNSSYWSGAAYLGLGPSAHGFDGHTRRWNEPAYAAWLTAVQGGVDPMAGTEALTQQNRTDEAVYLHLRTTDGLQLEHHERDVVRPWEVAGWVQVEPDGLMRCTPEGWLRLDTLAATLTMGRSP